MVSVGRLLLLFGRAIYEYLPTVRNLVDILYTYQQTYLLYHLDSHTC